MRSAARSSIQGMTLLQQIASALALLFFWIIIQGLFLEVPPLVGLAVVVATGGLFLWRYVLPVHVTGQMRRRAMSRARPLRGDLVGWVVLVAVATTLMLIALITVYQHFIPEPELALPELDRYLARPFGVIPFALSLILVQPLVEEVAFRGWIQRPLELRLGPEAAIVHAAALFSLAHFEPWGIPHRLLLGLASGYTVYRTRSIWAGVLLHMMFNAALFALDRLFPQQDILATLGATERGLLAATGVVVLMLLALALLWRSLARRTG